LFEAQTVHRRHFDPNRVQLSKLLNIKTGGCPEDCGYCSQSSHHSTGLAATKLMEVEKVVAEAGKRKPAARRATAWARHGAIRSRETWIAIVEMIGAVKALGLETCMTLGMLDRDQSDRLSAAGLDYYNHNIDTSARYYPQVTSTRDFADRLDTLENVRQSGMKVCCGGILGMGEEEADRVDMLVTLANLAEPPESVPINMLIPIAGTPLAEAAPIAPIEFVRIVALARIMMPKSYVRLSAGRLAMTDEMQALCFFAGANSIFVGDTLLTAGNPQDEADRKLFSGWDCRRSDRGWGNQAFSPCKAPCRAPDGSRGRPSCRASASTVRRRAQMRRARGPARRSPWRGRVRNPAGSKACDPGGARARDALDRGKQLWAMLLASSSRRGTMSANAGSSRTARAV
jgi:biotin synthase